MNKAPLASKCQLCEVNKAKLIMRNRVNGNEMKVCEGCYKEIWSVDK
jgi:protein-arginine kinase activator protein McsA